MNKLAIIIAVIVVIIIIALYLVFKMPSTWVQRVKVELKVTTTSTANVGGHYVQLNELEVLDSTGMNIALGAAVTGSSNYDVARFPYSNATDGDYTTLAHTAKSKVGDTEYIEVTLPVPNSAAEIGKTIVIHNRPGLEKRIEGVRVIAYDNYGAVLKEWVIAGVLMKYTFDL